MDFGFASHQPLGEKNRDPLLRSARPHPLAGKVLEPPLGAQAAKVIKLPGAPAPVPFDPPLAIPSPKILLRAPLLFRLLWRVVAGGSVFPLIQYLRASCFSIRT